MDKSEIKAFIAKRCAKELKDGDVVNLGIGLPTMIPSFLPEGVDLVIHAELGIVGAGATPKRATRTTIPIMSSMRAATSHPWRSAAASSIPQRTSA